MSGGVPLAGVIGDPIAQSLSPRLHAHWLRRHGIAGHFVPLHVAPADLGAALAAMPRMGFVGANVTVPHKEAALALASEATPRATAIGAANTLIFLDGGDVRADNTDGYGFAANLRQAAPDWRGAAGPAVVFGAGGACRAVLHALLEAGVPEIRLVNRTRARADALAERFGPRIVVHDWERADGAVAGAVTAVNTTTLGLVGSPRFDWPLGGLAPEALATDLVYAPLDTPFLQTARAAGARTVDGLGMLLHQARPGFEAWFGVLPEVTPDLRDAVLAG